MVEKNLRKIRVVCGYFIFTFLSLIGLFLLFRFQRFRFYIFILGMAYSLYFLLVSPISTAHILLFISQALPFKYGFSVFGKKVTPLEFALILTFSIWVSLYIIRSAKYNRKIKLGLMEFFLIVFMIVFVIGTIRGIYAGNYTGEKGRFFRADVFRGPIYYSLYFFFLKIMVVYRNSLPSLVKTWNRAVLTEIMIYFFLALKNYIFGSSSSLWGFNFQIFPFFGGWVFALWLLNRKPVYLFASVADAVLILFFIGSRTVILGIFLMLFFIIILWLIYFEKNKLKFILNTFAIMAIFGVVALIYYSFLSASDYKSAVAMLRSKQLLHIRYFKYFPSIQARIIETSNVIFNWKNSNKLLGVPFGEVISMYAGPNVIDVFYANLLGKMGLLGLFSFLGFMGEFFRRSVIVMKKLALLESVEVKAFVIMSVAMIPAALIMAITMNHLWFTPGTIITIAFSGAVITTLWNQMRKNI